jgi:hypothetical protein
LTTDIRPEKASRPRRLWTVVPAFLITLAILITIKATSLNGLPDVGEPFDIDEFSRPIPDEANAFVVYRRAFEKLGKEPDSAGGVWVADWNSASPVQRRWLDENRGSLELWKQGTARPDALYIPPKTLNIATLLPVIQGMRSFGRLAILEGTRLETEGDLNGALDCYLAVLRSSRHCGRRGVAIERLVGIAIGSMAATRLSALAIKPDVDAKMLRRALDGVIEADAMTPPASDSFKCEYIAFVNTIADPAYEDPAKLAWLTGTKPGWSWSSSGAGRAFLQAERAAKREPERSRRVYRLIFANWLAYCDRPRSSRPPFAKLTPPVTVNPLVTTSGFELFVPEGNAPESVKALSPDELAGWFHSTLYAEIFSPNFGGMDKALRRDQAAFANLLVTLANELHKREKGEYPAKVEGLVGPYLKALPEGYVPIDDSSDGKPKE